MSKGSWRRPSNVSKEVQDANWDRIFSKKDSDTIKNKNERSQANLEKAKEKFGSNISLDEDPNGGKGDNNKFKNKNEAGDANGNKNDKRQGKDKGKNKTK